ncbi:MAG TPA: helix-turn-helix transcriptional regulator [Ktedonobacteraceae bacterium]
MSTSTPNPRLRRERQLKGWSQSHVAKQIKVPDYYISRWERGDVTPSPYYQQRLCALFEKTAEELGFLLPEKSSSVSSSESIDVESPSKGEVEVPSLEQNEESQMSDSPSSEPKAPFEPVASTFSPTNEPVLPVEHTLGTYPLLGLRSHRRWNYSVSLRLSLVIALIVSAVVATIIFRQRAPSNDLSGSFVGMLSFSSSGVGKDTTSQGIADQIQIKLRLLQQPAADKRYYVWLMPDQDNPEGNVVPLGVLSIQGTTGQLSYHDPLHTDLLVNYSRLLITEQDVSPMPQAPTLDQSMWRYQAQIPQIRASGTPYSLLDHVRHLLASEPQLEQYKLSGGLAIWLKRNSEQMVPWATDARSAGDAAQRDIMRQDLFRLLDYLDGLDYVQQDLPGDTSALQLVDQRTGSIGLLNIVSEQPIRGYLVHIDDHLRGIVSSPGVSTQETILAEHILQNTDAINNWLQQARQDILQLLKNFDQPLPKSQTLQLLTDVSTLITFASEGKPVSGSGNRQGGADQVDEQILQLASMQIMST